MNEPSSSGPATQPGHPADASESPRLRSGAPVVVVFFAVVLAVFVAGGLWLFSDTRQAMSESVAARLAEQRREAAERGARAEAQRVAAVEALAPGEPGRAPAPLPVLPEREDPGFGPAAHEERERLAAQVLSPEGQRQALPHAQFAYVLARLGDGRLALEAANRALDLDPLLGAAWVARAHAHAVLGEPARAADDLARAERLSPADPAPWLLRGELAMARGDAAAAVTAYRRALELDLGPRLEATQRRLAAAEQLDR